MDRRRDVAVTCTWEYTIDAQGRRVRKWRRRLEDYGAFIGYLVVGKCPVWHPSIMIRRDVVLKAGGFDSSYAPAEDFDLWLRLAQARQSGAIVPQFLLLQRVHGNRQSVTRQMEQYWQTRCAHERLVREFVFPAEQAVRTGRLLRLEPEAWGDRSPKAELLEVIMNVHAILDAIERRFSLSTREAKSLHRVVRRRLGLGIQMGRSLRKLPAPLFRTAVFGLSPLLVPSVRRAGTVIYRTYRQLRFPWSFLGSRWTGANVPKTRLTKT